MESKESSKVRIVKCPKCCRLLPEFPDVPVYKCGACGAVLVAKKRQINNSSNGSHMLANHSSSEPPEKHVSFPGDSGSGKTNLVKEQSTVFSTDSDSIDINHGSEERYDGIPSEKSFCSATGIGLSEGDLSERTKNSKMEAALTDTNVDSTQQADALRKQILTVTSDHQIEIVHAHMDLSSKEEHGSVSCSSGHEISLTGSGNSLTSSEDIIDADPENMSGEKLDATIASSAHGCDDREFFCGNSISSKQCPNSSAVFDKEDSKFSITSRTNGQEDAVSKNLEDSKPDARSENSSSSSSEINASVTSFGDSNFNLGSSLNCTFHRKSSQKSDIFYSARKELEEDFLMSLSRYPSLQELPQHNHNGSPSGHENLQNEPMELSRNVDELQHHLTISHAQGQEMNKRFNNLGTRQYGRWSAFPSRGPQRAFQYCNSSISQTYSRASGQRTTAQPYQSMMRFPFPGQGNGSYLHYHPKDWFVPVQLPSHMHCNACSAHSLYHSSTIASSESCNNCKASWSHASLIGDQRIEKNQYREKRLPLKRHCRPVFGGAPFVICNNCLKLLQVPVDFIISGAGFHKLKCGGCSKVLVFQSHDGGHIVPHCRTQIDSVPSDTDNAMVHARRLELSTDHSSDNGLHRPVSYSEDYGPSFSYGYSTDGEPAPHVLASLGQERRRGKQVAGLSLHQLMGYDSATELIYQPSDDDEAYVSREMKYLHRISDEVYSNEVDAGTGASYPLHGQSEIECCSPEHVETPQENESVMGLDKPYRRGYPVRGLSKQNMRKLNHGLESMKLKESTGGSNNRAA